jgi:hypothetical protein
MAFNWINRVRMMGAGGGEREKGMNKKKTNLKSRAWDSFFFFERGEYSSVIAWHRGPAFHTQHHRKEGWKKEGRKEGRKERRKEGKKEGEKEERKEGRRKGRK